MAKVKGSNSYMPTKPREIHAQQWAMYSVPVTCPHCGHVFSESRKVTQGEVVPVLTYPCEECRL